MKTLILVVGLVVGLKFNPHHVNLSEFLKDLPWYQDMVKNMVRNVYLLILLKT